MFWRSKPPVPTAQYGITDFRRMADQIPRWVFGRAPDSSDDEILRLTVHVMAFHLHTLRSAGMSPADAERYIVAMVGEVAGALRRPQHEIQIAFEAAHDRLERHGMSFADSLREEIRSVPMERRSAMDEDVFRTVGSSACAAILQKLRKDGFAPA